MAKMNYNRPNGGYERESWKFPTSGFSTKSYWKDKTIRRSLTLNGHDEHDSDVRMISYKNQTPVPVLWCKQCDKHILTLSLEDYKIYKSVK